MKFNITHYNRMYDALITIANGYQTPDQLKRNSKNQYGLGYEETLEMAYENIQQLAKEATRHVRRFQSEVKVEKKMTIEPNDERGVTTEDAQ